MRAQSRDREIVRNEIGIWDEGSSTGIGVDGIGGEWDRGLGRLYSSVACSALSRGVECPTPSLPPIPKPRSMRETTEEVYGIGHPPEILRTLCGFSHSNIAGWTAASIAPPPGKRMILLRNLKRNKVSRVS